MSTTPDPAPRLAPAPEAGSSPSLAPDAHPPYGIAPPGGQRLPAATRLGPVRLQVADLGRSLAYYEGVLGLRALARGAGRATLGVGPDAARGRPLVELVERPGARPVPARGRLGLYHFALLLPDRPSLGRFVAHLGAAGVRAGASDHLVSEALYLTDPDGLGIEVYADRPRAEWRHRATPAGRELAMTTAPLDLAGLVQAAERASGGLAWDGMPAGTVMGHVHLHVGDLGRAAAFYHAGLGFDRVVWGYPGALFLSAGGYHHHLGVNTWAAAQPAAGEGDARLLEWTVELPSAEAVAAVRGRLGRDGVGSEGGREVVARDPWGTVVRVVGGW